MIRDWWDTTTLTRIGVIASCCLLLIATGKASAGAQAIGPEAYAVASSVSPGSIRQAIRTSIIKERKDDLRGNFLQIMDVQTAKISQKGAFARMADLPPYRDARPAWFEDFAGRGFMRFATYFDNGSGSDNFLNDHRPIEITSYRSALERITSRMIVASGKQPALFGSPIKVAANGPGKVFAVFQRSTAPGIRRSIRKLSFGAREKSIKFVRYSRLTTARASTLTNASDKVGVTAPRQGAWHSDTTDTCIAEGISLPKVGAAVMKGGGNPSRQGTSINIFAPPLTPECLRNFRRGIEGSIFMKNGSQAHPIRLVANERVYVSRDGSVAAGIGRGPAGHAGWPKKLLYRCTPGPGRTEVFGVFRVTVYDLRTGDALRHRSFRVKVKVKRPGPC